MVGVSCAIFNLSVQNQSLAKHVWFGVGNVMISHLVVFVVVVMAMLRFIVLSLPGASMVVMHLLGAVVALMTSMWTIRPPHDRR